MSSFVGKNDYQKESNMWIKADDGAMIVYLPLAKTSLSYPGEGSKYIAEGTVADDSYMVDEFGKKQNLSGWSFIVGDLVEYTQVP